MVDMAGGIGMDIDGIGFNITKIGIITGIKIGTNKIGTNKTGNMVDMVGIKSGKFTPKS
ncbi:hypothetical protein Lery_2437 [Legionella erythra]|uniref:Uncharacterized protein n=1 Tax=Legionella erythra TaxID=448 RepID=A0A0W0TFB5_LEGER|nr:hypothetical protein Lery_2437 [Legionella erythra]